MLVRFDSKAGTITMFGDVAIQLLKMMGQTGALPGAILAPDIPAALARLRSAVETQREPAAPEKDRSQGTEPKVSVSQRAFPLVELLERAAKTQADVIWDEEKRKAF